jgi:nuclear pore complex protein Nup210
MNLKYSLILLHLTTILSAYKLNVPKVLLPFHSSNVINFTLELINEDDDDHQQTSCFNWSTSRPEIVSIEAIYDPNSQDKCSTKAIVSAISKYPQRLTSIIIAKESLTDKIIRCDVIVDKITKISIRHTTTQLYLEDSPECFVSEAFDLEGNSFTTIEGLPFEWFIVNTDNRDSYSVLNMQKFIDSEYQVSDTIRNLELSGIHGNKILIEGVKTGTTNVQAKLLDPYYKSTSTDMVRLLVVANILLEPSYPVYFFYFFFIFLYLMSIENKAIQIKEHKDIRFDEDF